VSQNESAGEFAEKGDKRRVLGEGIKGGRLSRDQGRVQASDFPFSSASILTALPKKDFSSHPRRPHKFLLLCDFLFCHAHKKSKKTFFFFAFAFVCVCAALQQWCGESNAVVEEEATTGVVPKKKTCSAFLFVLHSINLIHTFSTSSHLRETERQDENKQKKSTLRLKNVVSR
jgi:hypothetical protein